MVDAATSPIGDQSTGEYVTSDSPKSVPWTAFEDVLLREAYARSPKAAYAALPNRTRYAINHRAWRIGCTRHKRWREHDIRQLKEWWCAGNSLESIAAALNRDVSGVAIRLRELGLSSVVPPGYEHLGNAAKRVGYHRHTLRKILAAHGVNLGRRGSSLRAPTLVRTADVDAAVQAWMRSESLTAAAERIGVATRTLAKRLMLAGFRRPGLFWRVSEDQVAKAMDGYRFRARRQSVQRRAA